MVTKKPSIGIDIHTHQTASPQKRNRVILFSVFLSTLLLFLSFHYGAVTNSLLLWELGLIQAGLTIFFTLRACSSLIKDQLEHLRYRLLAILLSGFSLLLSAGYMFCEIYDRFDDHIHIQSFDALIAASAVLLGNLLIIGLMIRHRHTQLWLGSFRLSFRTIGKISLTVLLATVVIHLTNYYFLDTILSLFLSVSLFIWAVFLVLDAYWRLGEVAE